MIIGQNQAWHYNTVLTEDKCENRFFGPLNILIERLQKQAEQVESKVT